MAYNFVIKSAKVYESNIVENSTKERSGFVLPIAFIFYTTCEISAKSVTPALSSPWLA